MQKPLAFERAYCLYRDNRFQDSLAALTDVDDARHAARLQLEAQLQYRMGNIPAAIDLYKQLFQQHKIDSTEVHTNILAALAAGGKASEIPATIADLHIAPKDSFEAAFNIACGFIEEEKYPRADEQLQVAYRVGEETLYDEELDEDEIAAELVPVTAQLAYLAAKQGRATEAKESLESISQLDCNDEVAMAVVAIDLCALSLRLHPGDRRVAAERWKALEEYVERSGGYLKVKSRLENRLGQSHSQSLLIAYASAAIAANKIDMAREAVRSIEKKYGGSPAAALLHATLLARDGKTKDADAALAACMGSGEEKLREEATLMRVQLAVAAGDITGAMTMLNGLPSVLKDCPAMVATRAAVLEQQGDVPASIAVLTSALEGTKDEVAVRWLLRRVALLHVEEGDLDAALSFLQRLIKGDPDAFVEDPELLTLVPWLMACKSSAAEAEDGAAKLLELLPRPPTIPSATLDGLEASGALASAAQRQSARDAAAVPGSKGKDGAAEDAAEKGNVGQEKKEKKKRKRKQRFPKGFDPENPGPLPDPERWLPKWQRSDAKKRKKRKDKDVTKGSQGAGKVDASLDRTGAVASAPSAAPSGKSSKKKGKR